MLQNISTLEISEPPNVWQQFRKIQHVRELGSVKILQFLISDLFDDSVVLYKCRTMSDFGLVPIAHFNPVNNNFSIHIFPR